MILAAIQLDHLFYGLALSSDSSVHALKSIGLISPAQVYFITEYKSSESTLVFRILLGKHFPIPFSNPPWREIINVLVLEILPYDFLWDGASCTIPRIVE